MFVQFADSFEPLSDRFALLFLGYIVVLFSLSVQGNKVNLPRSYL